MTVPWKMDYATRKSAVYATTNWHYSQSMPTGRLYSLGIWEDGQFIGVILFSRGANNHIARPYGLLQSEVVELTRVAMNDHANPVTLYVAEALRRLKADNPGLRIVVSYADPYRGHHGGIYQAGGWMFHGMGMQNDEVMVHGKVRHKKTLHGKGWTSSIDWLRANVDPNAEVIVKPPKLRYVYPLDKQMRRRMEKVRLDPPARIGVAGEDRR